jgi:hypothetical protein
MPKITRRVEDPKFLIFAPSFQDDSGGKIVLHYLCHLLNEVGCESRLFPLDAVPLRLSLSPRHYVALLKFLATRVKHGQLKYKTNAAWNTPVTYLPPSTDMIVVYPEIVAGNPLQAQNVVRWFLHRPGQLTGSTDFGSSELYFFYQEAFNDTQLNQHADNLLRIGWYRDDVYRKTNMGPRQGSCYMIRKGRGRPLVHDLSDSVLVDGLSHEKLSELFNARRYFISYDPYTMYSRFAAMCGCVPIVIPEPGVSKRQWRPELDLRLGIAYGFGDLEWAEETRPALMSMIEREKQRQKESVLRFIFKAAQFFAQAPQ